MRESEVERYLVRRVKDAGGEVRKVQWIGRRGAPDRVVMLPPMGFIRTYWVEVKAPGKKPTPAQLREHERMRLMGQHVRVVDSPAAVDRLLYTPPYE